MDIHMNTKLLYIDKQDKFEIEYGYKDCVHTQYINGTKFRTILQHECLLAKSNADVDKIWPTIY